MPIFTGLSTFTQKPLEKPGECSVCRKVHGAGGKVFWKSYKGRFNDCRVILCDENCHAEYDLNFWENKANMPADEAKLTRTIRIYKAITKEGIIEVALLVSNSREAQLREIEFEEDCEAMKNYKL
jgi:hypothetical protein